MSTSTKVTPQRWADLLAAARQITESPNSHPEIKLQWALLVIELHTRKASLQ